MSRGYLHVGSIADNRVRVRNQGDLVIKATEGQCEASEASYKHALKDRSERNYSRAILDLAVLYALCFNDKEKSAHYFNRYNSFVLDPVEREHVRELASEMGIKLDE
jgi:hypothetical protein